MVMKRNKKAGLFLLFLFLAVLLLTYYTADKTDRSVGNADYYVKVVSVSDGDTFTGLTDGNQRVRFRLQGVDAPERSQPYSRKSTDKLSNMIYGKRVGIEEHTASDQYGRPVVYVFTSDGVDVCAEMLRSGMAWHYKHYDKSTHYSELERQARSEKKGLWEDSDPEPPWDYRRRMRLKSGDK